MMIDWLPGDKCDGDRRLKVTTTNKEIISIYKLCLLINQIGINEKTIREEKGYSHDYFSPAVNEVVFMAFEGVDWAEENNLEIVKKWCVRNHLKFEFVEPELRKVYQARLKEYE